jgi:hypothetical protein
MTDAPNLLADLLRALRALLPILEHEVGEGRVVNGQGWHPLGSVSGTREVMAACDNLLQADAAAFAKMLAAPVTTEEAGDAV